jgi:hypothetical protein
MKDRSTVTIKRLSEVPPNQAWDEIGQCKKSPETIVLVGKNETGEGTCPIISATAKFDTGNCWANCKYRS